MLLVKVIESLAELEAACVLFLSVDLVPSLSLNVRVMSSDWSFAGKHYYLPLQREVPFLLFMIVSARSPNNKPGLSFYQ